MEAEETSAAWRVAAASCGGLRRLMSSCDKALTSGSVLFILSSLTGARKVTKTDRTITSSATCTFTHISRLRQLSP